MNTHHSVVAPGSATGTRMRWSTGRWLQRMAAVGGFIRRLVRRPGPVAWFDGRAWPAPNGLALDRARARHLFGD